MSETELTMTIAAAANAIAKEIPDNGQLAVLSAVLGQLSATLATIAAARSSASGGETKAYIHSL